MTLQSIVVHKNHPSVNGIASARKLAQRYGKTDRVLETSECYHFRQVAPGRIEDMSYHSEKVTKHITLIKGERK